MLNPYEKLLRVAFETTNRKSRNLNKNGKYFLKEMFQPDHFKFDLGAKTGKSKFIKQYIDENPNKEIIVIRPGDYNNPDNRIDTLKHYLVQYKDKTVLYQDATFPKELEIDTLILEDTRKYPELGVSVFVSIFKERMKPDGLILEIG